MIVDDTCRVERKLMFLKKIVELLVTYIAPKKSNVKVNKLKWG